eukprot:TRINITY_DN2733_c0_g2_i1.p1 TRINITY_DN2733_c0_g2~~TRINITY_DN2733_c0_g2_i1.p1  ORF type:complete len:596 (-),score=127.43 TRINITY_DN2733_c0_g2_i1:635-2422(-)
MTSNSAGGGYGFCFQKHNITLHLTFLFNVEFSEIVSEFSGAFRARIRAGLLLFRTPDMSVSPPRRTPGKGHVGIIGCGPSGLVLLKELHELGFEATAFECDTTVGGVYSKTYEEALLTTSNNNTSFGCFPHGNESSPRFWTAVEYVKYLERFADHFALWPSIRLGCRVVQAREASPGGVWTLTVECLDGDLLRVETREFDRIAVCCGINSGGFNLPDWPGAKDFRGQLLHSSQFHRASDFGGKRVVVAGLGESGSDIALLLAKQTEHGNVCVSTRSGPGYIIPRQVYGMVADLDTNRCYHSIPRWMMATRFHRVKTWLEDFWLCPTDDLKVLSAASAINRRRGQSPFHRFGTKNLSFVEAMVHHGAHYRPDIARLESDAAVFADGSRFECDAVISCNGFAIKLPFLDADIAAEASKVRSMYKRIFLPSMGDRIGFIGFFRPGLGSIPPTAEMQARLYAQVIAGKLTLPSPADMSRIAEADAARELAQFPKDAPRVRPLGDYLTYLEDLAGIIGCKPPMGRLFFTSPRLWGHVLFGPIMGAQYRLAGPGAVRHIAGPALCRVPTYPKLVLAYEFAALFVCKVLYFLGFTSFKPIGF